MKWCKTDFGINYHLLIRDSFHIIGLIVIDRWFKLQMMTRESYEIWIILQSYNSFLET